MALNIQLLETSFAKIRHHTIAFSARFYNNLFAIYPELKPLFENVDRAAQEKKQKLSHNAKYAPDGKVLAEPAKSTLAYL